MSGSPVTGPAYFGHTSILLEAVCREAERMTGIQVTPAAATRRSWLTMLVICTGYFLVILDATVVNVALPAIGRSLHAQVTGLQWVVDGYALVLAALLLSGGALAERTGGRRAFTIGLAIFATASAACACAPDLGVLLAARVAQGAGAAVLVPSSLMLLQAAYPDRRSRARALGVWGAVAGIGAAAGPVIGGLVVTAWSWRGAFWLNLPFALGALATAARLLGTLVSGINFMAGLHVALGAAAMAFVLGALVTIAGVRPPRPEFPSPSRDRHAEFRRDMARRLTSSPRETSSW